MNRWTRSVYSLGTLVCLVTSVSLRAEEQHAFRLHEPRSVELTPALPSLEQFPIQLVLDDGSAEVDFGVVATTSKPFLWMNQFDVEEALELEQVWVLFPNDAILQGATIELAIYRDDDGNPRNGAELLATHQGAVSHADGKIFSIYDLSPTVSVPVGHLYLGAISRYAQSKTPVTFPATLDTSGSEGRSWFVRWGGDPPVPPELPGISGTFPIDSLTSGSWLIRGFGSPLATPEDIPSLGRFELGLLAVWLSLLGWVTLRRRKKTRRG